ncbi:response regulator [Alkalihalobacillus sp. CinArs1]|uniref:response regulator n=1 Tax=Alkalihalobacillus sp. CinArs1 TaxID=2995314 RepID=UPI0022DE7CD4|nr:response regulator [Alkalihalobacillus sp. CinArs1]
MIQVMIVEDDPMVANLNKQYIEQVGGYQVAAEASNVVEALRSLSECRIDLILLDVYMPGRDGLQFLKELRAKDEQVDVILITAASEREQIQQSLRLGAVDYLIKPFDFHRLKRALNKYKENHFPLKDKPKVSQDEIDNIFIKKEHHFEDRRIQVPKGLTKTTLEHIIGIIHTKQNETFSTDEVAREADISRVSIRKYLKFLKEIDFLEETLIYGIGRPVYQYQIKTEYNMSLEFYH